MNGSPVRVRWVAQQSALYCLFGALFIFTSQPPIHMNWIPQDNEYAPFYASYVAHMEGKNVLQVLNEQVDRLMGRFSRLTDEQWAYRYAPGKWSIKELLGHLSDAERVFAYRAMRIGRGDPTPLPGFDENQYVANAGHNDLAPELLIEEWRFVRMSTILLRKTFQEQHAAQMGTGSGTAISLRALFAITAGHTEHHIQVMQERYGLKF